MRKRERRPHCRPALPLYLQALYISFIHKHKKNFGQTVIICVRPKFFHFKRVGCTRYQHRQPTLLYKFQNCRSVRTAFPSQLLVQILLAVLHNNALVSIVHALSGNVVSRSVNVLVNGNVVNTRNYAVERVN